MCGRLLHLDDEDVTLKLKSLLLLFLNPVTGGASLGFYHVGVARALLNEGLLPRVIRCCNKIIIGSIIYNSKKALNGCD